jgi:uncharacterized protein YqeY
MTIFNAGDRLSTITDHTTGKQVMEIMKKYLDKPMNEKMLDDIIIDIKKEFGENHPAQVNLDDETNDIEITVLDNNGRYIKCSSLTLFPNAK